MARPRYDGLFYFPLDVSFFADKKIKALRVNHKAEGIVVYLYCLCQIYDDKYYEIVDDNFIDCAAADLGIDAANIKEIIKFCCERGLFDKSLFEQSSILTGKSIQLRYQEAHKGAKRNFLVDDKIWLLSKAETLDFIKVECTSSKNNSETEKQANSQEASKITRESLVAKYGEREIIKSEQKYRSWQKKNGVSGDISYSAIAKFLVDDKVPEINVNLDEVIENLKRHYTDGSDD